MRKAFVCAATLLAVAAIPAWADWCDNFDSYTLGTINGQGGWKGWNNVSGAAGIVDNLLSISPPNSQQINGPADSVHEYTGYNAGVWWYTANVWIPADYVGGGTAPDIGSFFILLSRYSDNASNNIWTVQAAFNSQNGKFEANAGSSGPRVGVPYVTGQWSQILVKIYLDRDWTQLFYNGQLIDDPNVPNDPNLGGGYKWTKGVFGQDTGPLNIAAVDLFANTSSPVYYDNLSLTPPYCRGDMNCDGLVNFLDINAFVAILNGATPCNIHNADVNGDCVVDFTDINPFVAVLAGGGGPCP